MTSVWLEGKKRRGGRGGGQPSGLDRRRITEVTVRLLDAEGLGKFSMRRLAAELNVTAMSVYWYVDTKDDLLELALDAAYGELRLPHTETRSDPESRTDTGTAAETETATGTATATATGTAPGPGDDWRDQLRVLAGEYRALLVRHPWLSPLAGRFLNIGPNALAFSRAVQDVVRRTGLPAHRMTSAISAVFQFVYGYGTMEGHYFARAADVGMSPDDYYKHAVESVTEDPDAAHVVEDAKDIMAARGGDTVAEMLGRDFDFALDLLIAGIETTAARG